MSRVTSGVNFLLSSLPSCIFLRFFLCTRADTEVQTATFLPAHKDTPSHGAPARMMMAPDHDEAIARLAAGEVSYLKQNRDICNNTGFSTASLEAFGFFFFFLRRKLLVQDKGEKERGQMKEIEKDNCRIRLSKRCQRVCRTWTSGRSTSLAEDSNRLYGICRIHQQAFSFGLCFC